MGSLCAKQSAPDPFSQPGRTLSSAPPPKTTSSVPPSSRKVGGPPRTLGSGDGSSSSPNPSSQEDARRKAAAAAEARARDAKKSKGKLASQLNEQKRQTRTKTLEDMGNQELLYRAADANKDALRHD